MKRLWGIFTPEPKLRESENKVVPLALDACELVRQILKENGSLEQMPFGASVTAMRIVNQAIIEQWGPILKSLEQRGSIPVPASGLQILIESGKIDLSKENIVRKYEENRAKQEL